MATAPTDQEYMDASEAAYSRGAVPGLTPLLDANGNPVISPTSELSDGFYAEALVDPDGNIIIAYEGTDPGVSLFNTDSYDSNSLLADAEILAQKRPQALFDAAAFAQNVQQIVQSVYGGTPPIYVTGHSLGGADAEYAALQTGFGGVTFGAPGIPGYSSNGLNINTNLTDYVAYGDPVANFASDTTNEVGFAPSSGMQHVGNVQPIGSPSSGTYLAAESLAYGYSKTKLFVALGLFGNLEYHSISNYAQILGLTTPTSTTALSTPDEILAALYAPLGSSGQTALSEANVVNTNTIISPDFTVVLSPSGTTATIIQDGSLYTSSGAFFGDPGTDIITIDPNSDYVTSDQFTDSSTGEIEQYIPDPTQADDSDKISFSGTNDTALLINAASFSGTISNFQPGDTIDLVSIVATGGLLGPSNLLTVRQSEGDSIALQLDPADNFSGTSFNCSSDGNGGTDITASTWSVAPADPIVNEDAGQEVFAISRAGDISQAATVYVSTTDGSTVAGEDVNDGQFDAFSNQAVVFAAGQATATVPVTINDQQDSSGQEYNFGLQVSDGPSASANTIVSNPFSILDDDVSPTGTYSSVTYSYLGGPLYGTTDDDATYDNLGEFEGDVEGTVVFNNLPLDFSGPFTPTDWTVSALGVTSENTFPQDPRISEQAWGLDVQNGQIQLWSMEFFWASDSPTGNYLYVESSSRGDQASLGNYASASDIAGTWTIDSATFSSDVDLSPAAGQTQSLSDALRALRLNNQSAQNLTISGAGTIALNGTSENVPKVEVAGNLHLQNGALETDPITIDAGGIIFGYGTISGSQTVDGTVTATGGTLDIAGDVTGTGTLIIDGSSALLLEGTVAATESLSFTGSGASLIIGTSSSVLPTIAGFSSGDVIGIDGDSVTAALYSTMTDELTLTASSGAEFTLNFSGSNQPSDFVVSDGEVVDYALCFLEGTRILTPRGEIPIEEMQIGDLVMTGAGDTKPIKWIGRRAYDGRFIAGNHLALPVCIKQNAIAGRVPSRDLNVSPGHGIFVGGVLVPAWRLVNGVSITQAESVQSVSYINVELESHEVILANNCPAETFLNIGNFREQFQNADEFKKLYPDDDAEQKAFIPRLEEGFKLHAIQSYLAGRAGTVMPDESQDDMVRGFVDEAGPRRVCGWVQCVDKPEAPVSVDIWVGGRLVARTLANGYRADLRQAGLGSGCHGFDIPLPIGLSGPVRVRRAANQTEIVLTVAAEARAA